MTHFLIKSAGLGILSAGLAACVTPAYPTTSTPPPRAAAVEAPTVVAQASPAPTGVEPGGAPTARPVESQQLAPLTATTETPKAEAPPAASATMPLAVRADQPEPKPVPPHYVATGKVVDAYKMYRDYQVQKGDHLDAIARDLQTTRTVLVEANHLKKPDALLPGQHLKVPIEKAYVAQSGDTIAAVAKRFDLSVADLADFNATSERHKLRAGEQLALPSTIHDHGPVVMPPTRTASRFLPPGGYTPSPWSASPVRGRTTPDGQPVKAYPSVVPAPGATLTDAQVMAAGRGRFAWPVRGDILSAFGVKDVGRRNDGVDVKAPLGTVVHAAAAGEVVYAGDQVPGFGNLVLVKLADGWVTAYAHLEKVTVKMRQTVDQDQEIGLVGQSGGVSEPQLHFEVRYAPTPAEKAKPVDPLLVLPPAAG